MDSSSLPPPELLSRWMELVAERGGFTDELVMLDVIHPQGEYQFPVGSLRAPELKVLALGFVRFSVGRCSGFLHLERLVLVCCRCSGRELSVAVQNLDRLKTLVILGVNLAAMGAGHYDGVLEIRSDSLLSLEMMEAKAISVSLLDAPSLKYLVAGVTAPAISNPRVVWCSNPRAPLRLEVRHANALQDVRSLMLWQQRLNIPCAPLGDVRTLEASLRMGVPGQWKQLLDLVGQLPLLRLLALTRADECSFEEEMHLQEELDEQRMPPCIRDSLEHLKLHNYRAGGAEISLVTTVLATARYLLSVDIYPHETVSDQAFSHYTFRGCPRLSSVARVQTCANPIDG